MVVGKGRWVANLVLHSVVNIKMYSGIPWSEYSFLTKNGEKMKWHGKFKIKSFSSPGPFFKKKMQSGVNSTVWCIVQVSGKRMMQSEWGKTHNTYTHTPCMGPTTGYKRNGVGGREKIQMKDRRPGTRPEGNELTGFLLPRTQQF